MSLLPSNNMTFKTNVCFPLLQHEVFVIPIHVGMVFVTRNLMVLNVHVILASKESAVKVRKDRSVDFALL